MRPIDPNRLLEQVGRRIAELRRSREWTQQELADQLGVTLRYVQSVEGGGQNLGLRSLAGWANVLGVAVSALFEAPASRRPRPGRPQRG